VLSQNGKRLFAAPFASMELPVWNLENGQVTRLRLKHREGLLTAAFSDDGEWIVTTSYDAFASLWEVESGRELARFSGGFTGFRQAAISPDKTRVVLYRYEGELSVWDPANEQSMATLPIEAGAWPFAAWDPNTDCIATLFFPHLLIWRAPSWAEIEAAEKAERKTP
jgi:WD40 repeat protein